jgi:glutamate synthase (NADPH/NADH) small chain
MGWVTPLPPPHKTGKRVAVVGSGPAGLAAAQQLGRVGHDVIVFEKADRIGGLLRYGIPDFKMEKSHIDRRIAQMEAEGVQFRVNQHIGIDTPASVLMQDFDAVVLSGGAEWPRDLPVPGRELDGIHFAMDFLPMQNKVVAGDKVTGQLMATGKHVVVIGGGDTGSDCVGTSNRHGAKSITQFELLPQPPDQENKPLVWPYWPIKLRTSSSHEEGCERDWSVATKAFIGKNGKVEKLKAVRVEWKEGRMQEVPGSDFEMKADLVLLAMGFLGPAQKGLLEQFGLLGVEKDPRANVKATAEGEGAYQTANPKVFAAGDMRRGQSLVVWAIREGRQCARSVDEYLMGSSELPR